MFKLALVALLCAQAFARPTEVEIDPYIIGGTKAKEGEFPFAVALREPNSNVSFCAGALLSDRYVVTAAHCVFDQSPVRIGAGSVSLKSQTLYDVEKIILNPGFDFPGRGKPDIALLRLKTPIKLGGNIQTINFPVPENVEGKNGTAVGWGRTDFEGPSSQYAFYLSRPILSNKDCAKRISMDIKEGEICLLGDVDKGMWLGDGGSPMFYKDPKGKNYLVGLSSWGIPCGKGKPDVFARVSHFAEWLKKTMV